MTAHALKDRGQRLAKKYQPESLGAALKYAKLHRDHEEQVAIRWAIKLQENE